jgi:Leucine-rich repeat (LRR) protein
MSIKSYFTQLALVLAIIVIIAVLMSGGINASPLEATAHNGIIRASVDSAGNEANDASVSENSSMSYDGRYTTFYSFASNLVAGDTNGVVDSFVYDTQTDETIRISVDTDGAEGNGESWDSVISADSNYVAFVSGATNLVSGDTNDFTDVFVRDLQTDETTRVSVSSDDTEGDAASGLPYLSDDGRYVAFYSEATNLVIGDTNGVADVFVHDMQTGETTRVSVASDSTEGNAYSVASSISGDGRYVAFYSDAFNLVVEDTNSLTDVFVHDRQTGETTRISVASDGSEGNDYSYLPSISYNGRYVAFNSAATNLVADDTNGNTDVFVHDLQTGETTRVSVASDGTEATTSLMGGAVSELGIASVTADGRYVVFSSAADNLVPGGIDADDDDFDIFVHDRQTGETKVVSASNDGTLGEGPSDFASISADGSHVAFRSYAPNLVANDTNGVADIFVVELPTPPTISVACNADPALRDDDLIAAINAASSWDTLELAAGCTYTLTTVDNTSANGPNGLPIIDKTLTINGNGAIITRDGAAPEMRILEVSASGDLTLNDVTVSNGYFLNELYDGGAIYSYGTLVVDSATFQDNQSQMGGAIYSFSGTLTVIDSTLSNNNAGGGLGPGGAVGTAANSTAEITNSTFSGNLGIVGGAISGDGDLTVTNSVFDSNSAEWGGGGYGGAISYGTPGKTLTITGSSFSNNYADACGSAIYNYQGTANIDSSEFRYNWTPSGCGAINGEAGMLDITDSIIADNSDSALMLGFSGTGGIVTITGTSINNNSGPNGGGIYNDGSAVTITNSTISDNSTTTDGGAIHNNTGTVHVIHSTISDNSATNQTSGIHNVGGTVNVTGSIVYDSLLGGNCSGTITDNGYNISNDGTCGFSGDSVDPLLDAAGLQDNGGSTMTIALQYNSPAIDAGGVCGLASDQRGVVRDDGACDVGAYEYVPIACDSNALKTAITNAYEGATINLSVGCTYTLTTVDNTSANGPNGLPIIDKTLTISGNGATITRDDAAPEMRIFEVSENNELQLNNVTISNGYSAGTIFNGTAIYNGSGELLIIDSVISGNVNGSGHGAIYNFGGASIINSILSDNDAYFGGAIYSYYGSLYLEGVTFSNNHADLGGAIANEADAIGWLDIRNSTFSGNSAFAGGAIHNNVTNSVAGSVGQVTIDNSVFYDNIATGHAGAIAHDYGAFTITNSIFYNNQASVMGGAISNYAEAIIIENSVIYGNIMSDSGGGISNYTGTVTITNSTVSGNYAADGGGIFNDTGTVHLIHSTISSNSATNQTSGIHNVGGTVNVTGSIIHDGSLGGNCFGTITDNGYNISNDATCGFTGTGIGDSVDPLLDPAGLQDNGGPTQTIALQYGSPAIDAGGVCGLASDQRGVVRDDGACDIGAYEAEYGPVPQSEEDALLALYNGTNGASWTTKTNWAVGDPCTWYGVLCMNGHVIQVELNSNNLNGTIPDLSALTYLEVLRLGRNNLSGGMPDLSTLSSLQYLSLYDNPLGGGFSTSFLPTSIVNIDMYDCSFTGTIPDLSSLTNLEMLNLADNQLTGSIPDLSALTNLTAALALRNNQLSGTLPDMSTLTNLVVLDLSGNGTLSGSINAAFLPPNLELLLLDANQFSGDIPDLSALTSLVDIQLQNNQLTGVLPDLSALTILNYLNVSNNQLTALSDMSTLVNLRDIGASNNKISGNLPVSYLPPNLEELFIANNQLIGEVSLTLADLPLSWVILDYNALTATDPTLITFLDGVNLGWDDTQTVPVNNLATANPADTSIDLTWTAINYTADGGYYEVSYATNPAGQWTVHGQTADKTVTGYSVINLTSGTTYYFRVQTHTPAHDTQQNDLWSEYSANVSEATTGIASPIAPTVLMATVVSETQINLSWTDNSDDETDFSIERSPDGSTGWTEIDTVGADVTAYSDTTVACCDTYYYRVRAYRSSDVQYSDYSNIVNITNGPEAYPAIWAGAPECLNPIDISVSSSSFDSASGKLFFSNGDIALTGSAVQVSGDMNAVGVINLPNDITIVSGTHTTGVTPQANPPLPFVIEDFMPGGYLADEAQNDPDHGIYYEITPATFAANPGVEPYSWYNDLSGVWSPPSDSKLEGLYYIDGRVSINTNATSLTDTSADANDVWDGLTIATTKEINTIGGLTDMYFYVGGVAFFSGAPYVNCGTTSINIAAEGSFTGAIMAPDSGISFSANNISIITAINSQMLGLSASSIDFLYTASLLTDPNLVLLNPTALAATPTSAQIDLSWTDNSSDETAFSIERSADGSTNWTEIGTVSADVTTYSDTTVACSETHYYRVRAYRSGDTTYSDYSNVISATSSTCPVTTTTDIGCGASGLIIAINDANASAADDIINLYPDCTYTFYNYDNTSLSTGDNGLSIILDSATSGTLTINGSSNNVIERDGASNDFRFFYIDAGGDLTLNDMTITGGLVDANNWPYGYGGAVFNKGTLTVDNVIFDNNNAPKNHGGAIFNFSGLNISNSTFSNNSASYFGGAIYNSEVINYTNMVTISNSTFSNNIAINSAGGGISNDGGTVDITGSTFSSNEANGTPGGAGMGGAISNSDFGNLTITDSTFANNSATWYGGGLYSYGYVTITNSTFSNNHSNEYGGGVFNDGYNVDIINSTFYGNSAGVSGGAIYEDATTTVENTIIANSTAGGNCSMDGNSVTDGGNNISDDTTCGFADTNNLGTGDGVDALLDVLADNGGGTQTHALLTASPAINAGGACGLANDQRGNTRDSLCDIGAFEEEFTLTVAGSGMGNGTMTATGVNCTSTTGVTSGDCWDGVSATTFDVTATASVGEYTFGAWTGCDSTSGANDEVCSITLGTADTVITANFMSNTVTTITADEPDPSAVNSGVTIDFTVTSAVGTPTGDVSVTVSGGAETCTGTVAEGNCIITLTSIGNRTLTATYLGSEDHANSASTGVDHLVMADTVTSITSNTPNPSVVGQPVAVDFTVTSGYGTPTGNVTISDGVDSCSSTVAVGSCNITLTTLGARILEANYDGDITFINSTSSGVAHTVNSADTTTTIILIDPEPSVMGRVVTVYYSVIVDAPGGGTPTGNVTIDDGVHNCTGTVMAGSCAIIFTTDGITTLTASYEGDTNFNSSISGGDTHKVISSIAISESELFNQMQTEIANTGGDIDFALLDFVPGAINFTVRTKDGTVGTVVVYVEDGADFGVFSVGAISVDGDYATTINSELIPLLISSLDELLNQKIGINHDLMEITVADTIISAVVNLP